MKETLKSKFKNDFLKIKKDSSKIILIYLLLSLITGILNVLLLNFIISVILFVCTTICFFIVIDILNKLLIIKKNYKILSYEVDNASDEELDNMFEMYENYSK